MKTYQPYINGEFVTPQSTATLDVIDPATTEVIARVPDMSAAATPYDFRPGVPAGRHFPYATWRALLSAKARSPALSIPPTH